MPDFFHQHLQVHLYSTTHHKKNMITTPTNNIDGTIKDLRKAQDQVY